MKYKTRGAGITRNRRRIADLHFHNEHGFWPEEESCGTCFRQRRLHHPGGFTHEFVRTGRKGPDPMGNHQSASVTRLRRTEAPLRTPHDDAPDIHRGRRGIVQNGSAETSAIRETGLTFTRSGCRIRPTGQSRDP